jgi:transposase
LPPVAQDGLGVDPGRLPNCGDRSGAATRTAVRHTSREFLGFLAQVLAECRPQREIHIILDNLSAHKAQAVREFLARHPGVQLHFTPTYSWWLNQVELRFGQIERDVIARGVFTSVRDLARKLRRFINAYSANARPIQWKYSDPTRRLLHNGGHVQTRQSAQPHLPVPMECHEDQPFR